jgi:hypothetical protein
VNDRLHRHAIAAGALLVFLAAALWCNGYSIGLVDHAIHLPFLMRELDPSYLPGDLLVEAGAHHTSLFWVLQAPLVEAFGLEPTYFVLQLASWLAMLAGMMSLARALAPAEHARLAGWLACVPAVLVPYVFGGIESFDNLVLNRTVVMGGELFALALAIRGRGFQAFLLLGVLVNIHATTAVHTAAFAGAILLVQPERWRQIPRAFAGVVLGAAPLIVMTLRQPPAPAVELDYDTWRGIVELHYPFHHFLEWMDHRALSSLVIGTLPLLAAWRKTGNLVWVSMFATMVALVCGNFVATEVLRLRIGTVLHLYEAGRLVMYLSWLAAPVVLIATRADTRLSRVAAIALQIAIVAHALLSKQQSVRLDLSCAILAGLSTVALCIRPARTDHAPRRLPPAWTALVVAAALSLIAAHLRRDDGFGYHVTDVERDERWARLDYTPLGSPLPIDAINGMALMYWAREHLAADAVVVTPPFFVHPLANFRFHARRSLFVTHKDGGEATFDSAMARSWYERMEAVTGGIPPLRRVPTGVLARWLEMHRLYDAGDETRFRGLRRRYGATHVLCGTAVACASLKFPIVYEDAAWRLFAIDDG